MSDAHVTETAGPRGWVDTAPSPTVTLRLFASAREAAGTGRIEMQASTVADVLVAARERFGAHFAEILDRSRVWVNGEPAEPDTVIAEGDEVAVLPPVSGGAGR